MSSVITVLILLTMTLSSMGNPLNLEEATGAPLYSGGQGLNLEVATGAPIYPLGDSLSADEATDAPLMNEANITTMDLFDFEVSQVDVRPGYQRFGDMILPENFFEKGAGKKPLPKWPNGQVFYVIDASVAAYTAQIERAMRQYNVLTCVRFTKRTNQADYITIRDGTGCSSYVGKAGGNQKLILQKPSSSDSGCMAVGTIVHELGHAVGLIHEHQRSDRDSYINVFMDNVQAGKEHNFNKVPAKENDPLTKYDYSSIMHYGSNAFSNGGNRRTMTAKNGTPLKNPYEKPGFTNNDVDSVKKLYSC